jgi:hypothetical protein
MPPRNVILWIIPLNLLAMQVVAIRMAFKAGRGKDIFNVKVPHFLDQYVPFWLKMWSLGIILLCLGLAWFVKS